jgi:hypothetical protein
MSLALGVITTRPVLVLVLSWMVCALCVIDDRLRALLSAKVYAYVTYVSTLPVVTREQVIDKPRNVFSALAACAGPACVSIHPRHQRRRQKGALTLAVCDHPQTYTSKLLQPACALQFCAHCTRNNNAHLQTGLWSCAALPYLPPTMYLQHKVRQSLDRCKSAPRHCRLTHIQPRSPPRSPPFTQLRDTLG